MSKINKSFFFDGQVFQSAAWDRGMGKYSLALLKALALNKKFDYSTKCIIFTKNLSIDPVMLEVIKKTVPDFEYLEIDLKIPLDPCQANIAKMQKDNEEFLTNFIKEYCEGNLNNVEYVIPSLFIDQVCSVFPVGVWKILLMYDLIPLQYSEMYGQLCTFDGYLTRYRTVMQADIIWTISQTVADDVSVYLGISTKRLFNIDGAPIERRIQSKKPKIKIPKTYIIMPSGNDLRKNNIRAVQGFEDFRRRSGNTDIHLIITSFFDSGTRQSLEAYSSNLIFTGNVAEEELKWLYENAESLLFAPEYEGLGLPILEAAEVSKPIICSNLSVFNEISEDSFYYSDPYDIQSISLAIEDAYNRKDFKYKLSTYPTFLNRYTWPHTAEKALGSLADYEIKTFPKIKIAILAPSPSGYSDIGKRVMLLHPAMAEYFDIDYYVETGKTKSRFSRPNYLSHVANVYDARNFNYKTYRQYEAVVYHLGNSEFHVETIKNALYLPGFAIFHDTHLANIFHGELLEYKYISSSRLDAEKLLDNVTKQQKTSFITSLANRQQAIMVHSDYAQKAIDDNLLESVTVIKANLPVSVPKQLTTKLDTDTITIGFAGIIHPAKGLDIIEIIAKSDKFYNCKIHIFGLSLVTDEIIRQFESYPNVSVDINITDFQFQTMLSQLDILVNFRKDYRGETSAATLEAIRFGVIPIVRNVGWYKEMPDDVVIKVDDSNEIIDKLEILIIDSSLRNKMKIQGRKLLETQFTYESYAEKLYDLISSRETINNPNKKLASAIKQSKSKKFIRNLVS